MEKDTLALEMLKELKHQSKRWFIIAIIELIIIIATTGIFVWYINQPIEEIFSINSNEILSNINQNDKANNINNIIAQDKKPKEDKLKLKKNINNRYIKKTLFPYRYSS